MAMVTWLDVAVVPHLYLEAGVTLTPLLHAVQLTGIGRDQNGLDV